MLNQTNRNPPSNAASALPASEGSSERLPAGNFLTLIFGQPQQFKQANHAQQMGAARAGKRFLGFPGCRMARRQKNRFRLAEGCRRQARRAGAKARRRSGCASSASSALAPLGLGGGGLLGAGNTCCQLARPTGPTLARSIASPRALEAPQAHLLAPTPLARGLPLSGRPTPKSSIDNVGPDGMRSQQEARSPGLNACPREGPLSLACEETLSVYVTDHPTRDAQRATIEACKKLLTTRETSSNENKSARLDARESQRNVNRSLILQETTSETNLCALNVSHLGEQRGRKGKIETKPSEGDKSNVEEEEEEVEVEEFEATNKLKTKIKRTITQSVIIKQIPLSSNESSCSSSNQLIGQEGAKGRKLPAEVNDATIEGLSRGIARGCLARRKGGVGGQAESEREGREECEREGEAKANYIKRAGERSESESCDIADGWRSAPETRPGRRRRSSLPAGKRRASSLSSSIACLLLAWMVLPSGPRLTTPSRAQSSGGAESTSGEELSRAVLATMSTQAPVLEPATSPLNSSSPAAGFRYKPVTRAPPPLEPNSEPGELPPLAEPQPEGEPNEFLEALLSFLRIFIMSAIIIGDICGNSLVILSVCRHSKLRVTTNWFVVSLACADILVALFAMTFNASVIISGRWLFKGWVCDFWNSCDVLASTASILHLCCISIDRYVAIMRPLDYPMKITTRRVMYTLCGVWISSALLSYLPIFTGVYTTSEHIKWLEEHPDQCEFVVNRVYAIVSSSISFWIPCCIMIFVYYRIFREATRQEKFIYKAQSMMPAPMPNHHHHHHQSNHQPGGNNLKSAGKGKQRRSKSVAVAARSAPKQQQSGQEMQSKRPQGGTGSNASTSQIATTNLAGSTASIPVSASAEPATSGAEQQAEQANKLKQPLEAKVALPAQPEQEESEEEPEEDSNSGQSTPTNRSISKMKREHKAAKTLGIIMGVFILCWLPFFSWYTPTQICGRACDKMVPKQAVTILFWIGYFNSTLNPIIYAYFNHEFRDAFKKTLQWIFCCCNDLKCLRVNRPNDNQHYNCTYRSTQEIGLVNS